MIKALKCPGDAGQQRAGSPWGIPIVPG